MEWWYVASVRAAPSSAKKCHTWGLQPLSLSYQFSHALLRCTFLVRPFSCPLMIPTVFRIPILRQRRWHWYTSWRRQFIGWTTVARSMRTKDFTDELHIRMQSAWVPRWPLLIFAIPINPTLSPHIRIYTFLSKSHIFLPAPKPTPSCYIPDICCPLSMYRGIDSLPPSRGNGDERKGKR